MRGLVDEAEKELYSDHCVWRREVIAGLDWSGLGVWDGFWKAEDQRR